jgi:hypothetical protein
VRWKIETDDMEMKNQSNCGKKHREEIWFSFSIFFLFLDLFHLDFSENFRFLAGFSDSRNVG